jgi:type I restriction enzyme M protein
MNLAVHGLEGDIRQALTYYEDPLNLLKKCDYVMANPPFNVDEVDAGKIENDPRLPFGLPGVTTAKGKKNGDAKAKGRVQNGNYLWIQYFYSYLNARGRAGFVMSSQASSAGRDEAKVRGKLVQTGHVDIMVAIRPNFFYTRAVPCELWFLDKHKPAEHADKVLMLDARAVYRKVTRKIYDFSPEQLHNLLSIVWLYRGQSERFRALVAQHLRNSKQEAAGVPALEKGFIKSVEAAIQLATPNLALLPVDASSRAAAKELDAALPIFRKDSQALATDLGALPAPKEDATAAAVRKAVEQAAPSAERTRDLGRQADHLFKLLGRVIESGEKGCGDKKNGWNSREINRARKSCDEARHALVEQLRQVRYFHRHATWLTARFPEARLADVPGLVKLVDRAEIERSDWSLTPGRYVSVAPEEVDEDFDFEEAIRDIHVELEGLNQEATEIVNTITKNLEELIG